MVANELDEERVAVGGIGGLLGQRRREFEARPVAVSEMTAQP